MTDTSVSRKICTESAETDKNSFQNFPLLVQILKAVSTCLETMILSNNGGGGNLHSQTQRREKNLDKNKEFIGYNFFQHYVASNQIVIYSVFDQQKL